MLGKLQVLIVACIGLSIFYGALEFVERERESLYRGDGKTRNWGLEYCELLHQGDYSRRRWDYLVFAGPTWSVQPLISTSHFVLIHDWIESLSG